ncbi:MAG: DinB family protein [Dehalococcoidia bacterium]
MPYPPIDVTAMWSKTSDSLVTLVDYIPDDKLNWSPREHLWNFKGLLIHTITVRHNWLENAVGDGAETPNVLAEAQAKDAIREHLQRSWERVERFMSGQAKLHTVYEGAHPDGVHYSLTGHWIAYHLLEHDIHHRADIFHYLALLGIEHPDVGTP